MVDVKSHPEALDEANADDFKHTVLHEIISKVGDLLVFFFLQY